MKTERGLAWRDIRLQHPEIEAFVNSRCGTKTTYLMWRVFWAGYHWAWVGAGLILFWLTGEDRDSVYKWGIYLSNWAYFLLACQCLLELLVILWTWSHKEEQVSGSRLTWPLQITWLLYTVSGVSSVVVTAWYWTYIHRGKELTAVRFNTHAMSSIYVVLNMAVTRMPFRLLHFLYPVAFGVIYIAFSALYFACGGTNQSGDPYIYSVLDWSKPGRTLVVSSISTFLLIPIVHVLLWALNRSFQAAHRRLCPVQNTHRKNSLSTNIEDANII